MTRIAGSLALVCGAGSGIGRAIALSLASRKARLLFADISLERLENVAKQAGDQGADAAIVQCDAHGEDFADTLYEAAKPIGQVDILVNNIGVLSVGFPQDIPPEEWVRALNINLLSMVRAIHRFLPGMIERKRGHIVNTGSFAGLYPYAYDRLPYATSKGAIFTMSEGLALYLRPQGIGVTCLCPGPVRTNIGETARSFSEGLARRSPPFPVREPAQVGEQVAMAIEENRFFLPTDPDVRQYMMERAADPDAFLERQIAALSGAQSNSAAKAG